MKVKNIIKVLPLVFLLTGCNTKESGSRGLPYEEVEKSEQISEEEYLSIANTLKNNYDDYSKVIATSKVEIVESTGGESRKFLNYLLSLDVQEESKFYVLGNTASSEVVRTYRLCSTYINNYESYYFIDGRLVASEKFGVYSLDPDKTKVSGYYYFNEDGLLEREESVYDRTFDDNTRLFIYCTGTCEYIK